MNPGQIHKTANIARRAFDDFRDFLSPSSCLGCHSDTDASSRYFCGKCSDILRYNSGHGPVCPFCGRPDGVSGTCWSCREGAGAKLFFWGEYEGFLRDCIIQFKFRGAADLGRELTNLAVESLSSRLADRRYDMIVPVPLYRTRKWKREFNQSEVIAESLSRVLDIEYRPDIIRRIRKTSQQAKLTGDRRWENVKDAFDLAENTNLSEKSILLVDDIVTSGATVFEASKPFKQAGAAVVDIFSLAYTV